MGVNPSVPSPNVSLCIFMVSQSPVWLPSVHSDGQQWSGSLVWIRRFWQCTTTSLQSGMWLRKQDLAQPSWMSEQLTTGTRRVSVAPRGRPQSAPSQTASYLAWKRQAAPSISWQQKRSASKLGEETDSPMNQRDAGWVRGQNLTSHSWRWCITQLLMQQKWACANCHQSYMLNDTHSLRKYYLCHLYAKDKFSSINISQIYEGIAEK